MSKPYVTALIGTYNQGRFIEEAVDSVLAQDFPQQALEIIVVDDGSTDDTRERVDRYRNRIRYIYKSNGGQASALNLGFAESQGEIIALLDGDDVWLPGKLSAVVEKFEEDPGVGMVYHPFEYFQQATSNSWVDRDFPAVSGNVLDSCEQLLRYGDISTSGMAFRRNTVQSLLPIPECLRIYADAHLGYLAFFLAPVAALSRHLTRYRIHSSNLHATRDPVTHARASVDYLGLILSGMHQWLEQHGFRPEAPEIRTYLERFHLKREEFRFQFEKPGRLQLMRFCVRRFRLYAPVWTLRYKLFRIAMDATALILGREGFAKLQGWYARHRGVARFREAVLATHR